MSQPTVTPRDVLLQVLPRGKQNAQPLDDTYAMYKRFVQASAPNQSVVAKSEVKKTLRRMMESKPKIRGGFDATVGETSDGLYYLLGAAAPVCWRVSSH